MQYLGVYTFTLTPNDAVEWLKRDQCLSVYCLDSANGDVECLGSDQWLSADTFAWTLQMIALTGRRETASGVYS